MVDDDLARSVDEIVELAGVERDAAATIVTYLAAARAVLGVMPTQDDLVIERFFDESGGMQLVVHSPYGGRLNRALGYALRKKFCAGFNFELQASANDDAIVISLGPHHSFPLADVPRFLSPGSIRATLQQAILDQPIFQSRWRWNLNRSLVVLRFRGGQKVPPPLQRMQSDDLLAAVFPGAAACQENVTRADRGARPPAPAPGGARLPHRGARLRRARRAVAAGRGRRGALPLRRLHRAVPARPRDPQRRALRVPRRRRGHRPAHRAPSRSGGACPSRSEQLGRVTQEAIDRVRAEIEPAPTTPDELHDLLSTLLLSPVPAGVGRAPRRPPAPRPGGVARRRRRLAAVAHRRGDAPRCARWSRASTSTAPPPSRRRPRCSAATWRWPPR